MTINGILSKMHATLAQPVQYQLMLGNDLVPVNELVGKPISINYLHSIYCLNCGKATPKSFAQGYCYKCFISAPETEDCVLRPELCRAHEGIARDMQWATEHCLQPHFVYLAVSSDIKVGVTRKSQVPTRWIDQGAWRALILAQTPNRYTAGLIEVELKKHIADKTNWQRMLKNQLATNIDLVAEKSRIAALLPDNLAQYITTDNQITEISYPVTRYPNKLKSVNLERDININAVLAGIKGQYLIFNNEQVINIRTHGGYEVSFSY